MYELITMVDATLSLFSLPEIRKIRQSLSGRVTITFYLFGKKWPAHRMTVNYKSFVFSAKIHGGYIRTSNKNIRRNTFV